MEDAHIATISVGPNNHYHIFGVFDGHGGKEVSRFAKKHFVEELLNNQNFKRDDIKSALEETFLKIDQLLLTDEGKKELKKYYKQSKKEDDEQDKEMKKKNKIRNDDFAQYLLFTKYLDPKNDEDCDIASMTGCTACVLLVDETNRKLYFANSGDSRAVLCKKGIAYQMSLDHKPDLAQEKNRIYKAEGWVTEGRIQGNLNLSRSLGDLEYKQGVGIAADKQMITAFPEINIEILDSDCNFVILGCDGIWDCLTNQGACDLVETGLNQGKHLTTIIENIMDKIVSKDMLNEDGIGSDNMTCIIVQFKQ